MFYVDVLCFAVPINSRLCKLFSGEEGDIFICLGEAVRERPYLLACNYVTKSSGLINPVLDSWFYLNASKQDVRGADNNCQVPSKHKCKVEVKISFIVNRIYSPDMVFLKMCSLY